MVAPSVILVLGKTEAVGGQSELHGTLFKKRGGRGRID